MTVYSASTDSKEKILNRAIKYLSPLKFNLGGEWNQRDEYIFLIIEKYFLEWHMILSFHEGMHVILVPLGILDLQDH